ncbi:MAG: formate dehydrogenase subunit gamma [Gammaproteobacteria bacterium]|nr:formate dehydrogenase subunit gamma [Gammaproteobacteria bacterium]
MTVSEFEREQATTRAIDRHGDAPGALLPVLHAIQDALHHIPVSAIDAVAQRLNLSRADIHGVISFYHDFRHEPPGRHIVRLCRAEACQAMGGRALEDDLRSRLQIDFRGTTADGNVTLEPVYCFGACACAPAAMIDGTLHGRLDTMRLAALLRDLEAPR